MILKIKRVLLRPFGQKPLAGYSGESETRREVIWGDTPLLAVNISPRESERLRRREQWRKITNPDSVAGKAFVGALATGAAGLVLVALSKVFQGN